MNQILVTKKLYITPELKRKKKLYKFEFLLSIFFVVILISACIYAEYDRNKSEEVSKDLLADLNIVEDTTVAKNNVLVVVIDDEKQQEELVKQQEEAAKQQELARRNNTAVQKSSSGYQYATIATVNIPAIGVTYPVIDGTTDTAEETEELLKIAPTKFWGPEPNEVGNFCIVGHNYRNTKFFSKVPNLEIGGIVEVTDLSGRTMQYRIYNKYQVDPTDVSCTTQLTNGKKEVTLITCTNDSKQRVVVKAREI